MERRDPKLRLKKKPHAENEIKRRRMCKALSWVGTLIPRLFTCGSISSEVRY